MVDVSEDTMFNLNDHIFRLLQTEPFFAALSRKIEKQASDAVPTAGVRVNPDTGYFEMIYNPSFFEGLDDRQRTGVLVHEFYHLVFEHVTGRLPDELAGAMQNPTPQQRERFKLWNIAADLAINYHIGQDNLPEKCCIPGGPMFEDVPGGKTAEFYFDLLKQKVEEQEQEGQGGGSPQAGDDDGDGSGGSGSTPFDADDAGQFDSHDDWGGEACSEAVKEIAKERLQGALKDAAQEASKKGSWGSVSADCRKDIMERLTPKVDWKKVLRWFVKCSQRADKRSTPRRLNKRYAYVHPGRKIERQANIAISIDQSGSVSDHMLALFYAELNKLSDIATFTVIPFDNRVAEDKVFVWKKGQTHPQKRYMYGGTCFNAPTEYVNKHKFDAHIVLTDLEAPKPKPSKCPRMWMTTPEYARRPYFRTNERIVAVQ
jgi:predicted metal-dependent peptidase